MSYVKIGRQRLTCDILAQVFTLFKAKCQEILFGAFRINLFKVYLSISAFFLISRRNLMFETYKCTWFVLIAPVRFLEERMGNAAEIQKGNMSVKKAWSTSNTTSSFVGIAQQVSLPYHSMNKRRYLQNSRISPCTFPCIDRRALCQLRRYCCTDLLCPYAFLHPQ